MKMRSVSSAVMPEPVLRVEGVSKRFGGVQALKAIDFEARAGEVHALVGENGAGKSTLVKILSGIHSADAGTIRVRGTTLDLARPQDATAAGISAIHQEPSMFDELTVAENIFCRGTAEVARARVDRLAAHDQGLDRSFGRARDGKLIPAVSLAT